MKNIIVILCLIITVTFPNMIANDNNNDSSLYLTHYENFSADDEIVTFPNTEKVIKSSLLPIENFDMGFDCEVGLCDSFIATLKINSLILTIKYGSTLILTIINAHFN